MPCIGQGRCYVLRGFAKQPSFLRETPWGSLCFIADIVVGDIIIELKSVTKPVKAYEVQLVNHLVATGKPVGLLINFGERKAEAKRKLRELSCGQD